MSNQQSTRTLAVTIVSLNPLSMVHTLRRPIYAYVCNSPTFHLAQVVVHAIRQSLVDVHYGNHNSGGCI